jgi:hypothetical protein
MQCCRVGPPVNRCDPHQDIFRTGFSILHKDVEVSVFIENPGVKKFIFHLVARSLFIRLHEILIRIGGMGIFVEIFHVRVGRRAVKIEVVFFHVLTVIALTVGQPKEALFEDGILSIPEGQGEAKPLFFVRDTRQTILSPPVGPRAGVIVSEEVPGVTVLAVILTHSAPLPLGQIRPPLFPAGRILI